MSRRNHSGNRHKRTWLYILPHDAFADLMPVPVTLITETQIDTNVHSHGCKRLEARSANEMYGMSKKTFIHRPKCRVHCWQGYILRKKVRALFHHTYVNSKPESGGNMSLQDCFQHLQVNGSFKSRCSTHACLRSKFPCLQLGDNVRQACLEAFLSHWSTSCCCL